MNRRHLLGIAAGGLAAPLSAARAQDAWPSRPVTIIVPFAPGSSSDIVARGIAQALQVASGKGVVVENRPGATGEIGARVVIRAAPDGTVLMHAPISTWAINTALRPNLSYDPTRDFTGLMQTVRTPNVLVVNPAQVPATDLPGFIAWLKERGGRAAYSSSGVGSSDHLTAEMFKQRTGTEASHVPYSGGAPATTDLIAGNVQFSFQNLGSIAPQIRDGRVRAIMTTAEARNPTLPETPPASEAGLADFVVYSWQALGAPPGMAPALATQVHDACARALRQPETTKRLTEIGFEIVASTPADFASFQRGEIARWKDVVQKGRIAAE